MEPRCLIAGNRGPFTLDGTRTYLVGVETVAIIDPGPALEAHVGAVVREARGARRVSVLLTHGHQDHAGAAVAVADALGARILGVGHERATPLADGASVRTDHGELLAFETPGHSRPHLSFHWREVGALFPGDLVLGEGETTWVGEYPGCVADYLSSLARVRELAPGVLYPAHGPPIRDVPRTLNLFEEHRLDRIRQVRAVLTENPDASASEVMQRVYGDTIPEGLEAAALKSVQVLLHHLEAG